MFEHDLLDTRETSEQARPVPPVVLVTTFAALIVFVPSTLACGLFAFSALDLQWHAGHHPHPNVIALTWAIPHFIGFAGASRASIALYHRGSLLPMLVVIVASASQGIELLVALLIAAAYARYPIAHVPWWLLAPMVTDAIAFVAGIAAIPACHKLDREWESLLPG